MTEREAFIDSIVADPGDDTVRLAFADWLQEHNEDTRAEFIRVSCRFANRQQWQDDPDGVRANELLLNHWPEWFADLFAALAMPAPGPRTRPKRGWQPWRYGPYGVGANASPGMLPVLFAEEFDRHSGRPRPGRRARFLDALSFDRGFVSGLHIDLGDRRDPCSLGAVLKLEPATALGITLAPEPKHWRALTHPALNRLRELTLWLPYPGATDRDYTTTLPGYGITVDSLLNDTNLSRVRALTFYGSAAEDEYDEPEAPIVPPELVACIAGSRVATTVARLKLCVGRAGALAFANAEMLPELRVLDLSENWLDREDTAAFALPGYRDRLEELHLSQNGVNGAALAAGRPWARLRTLTLSYTAVGTNEWATLGRPEVFPVLTQLVVGQSYARVPGALTNILRDGGFAALRILDMNGCNCTESDAIALAEVVARTGIRELNLCNSWSIYRDAHGRIRDLLGDRVKLDPPHDPPDPNDPIPF